MATDRRFARYAAIDWSGAAMERPPGLAIAVAEAGDAAPRLLDRRWSRPELQDWILSHAGQQERTLIGIDLSFSLPFLDTGAFLPGQAAAPADARSLWAMFDRAAAGAPHMGFGALLTDPGVAAHFRQQGRLGHLFPAGLGRLRRTEVATRAMGLMPCSVFNLVGAAQVGKSSLTGMRMLHALDGRIPIWPFDPLPETGPVVVEFYTAVAIQAAGRSRGRKIRDAATLDNALAALGSAPHAPLARYDDHRTDAILAAAWLRAVAHHSEHWRPAALSDAVAATEGWTFGVG